jgi:predicted dehydrogenase
MANVMIVGLGKFSKRCYIPTLLTNKNNWNVKVCSIVDLIEQKGNIEQYLNSTNGGRDISRIYLKTPPRGNQRVSSVACKKLDSEVKKHNIDTVIISTDPVSHYIYAKWALSRGLSTMVNKPITLNDNITTSQKALTSTYKQFRKLKELYIKQKKKSNLCCSVMTQRRYHPAIQKLDQLVKEVLQKTAKV